MARPMIERMARALCTHAGNPENTKFEGKPMWQNYVSEARAVLAAMREPTEAMLDAGKCTREHWQRMIEVVRAEG